MKQNQVLNSYDSAKEVYESVGVDVESAISLCDSIPVSMQCWQGDDVIGFDGYDSLTGGIQTTGNYPGRATSPQQLREDIAFAKSLIPGKIKLNLHASYAEKGGDKIDRDAYTVKYFRNWIDFAKEQEMGLDFNPTFFSSPRMDGDYSLSSFDPDTRKFWIEHGKRCREIGLEFAKELGQPCAVNYWMPDGYKDICVDTKAHRDLMTDSLDQIFAEDISKELVPCGIESKLFGLGVESYTVASHEYSLGYAISRGILYTLDAGHFHPTETISSKITSCLQFVGKLILHISRGVRWDSDHVIVMDDELQNIMNEIIWNRYQNRVFIALDYFDASINRTAAWGLGMRNARKAILKACLAPIEAMREAEHTNNFSRRLALYEENKTLPFGAVWDYYCMKNNVPMRNEWIDAFEQYEKDVLSKRES